MQYQSLGKSSLNISKIAFGCMSLGNEYADTEKILKAAVDGGINYFDTADIYNNGQNEIMVGKALKPVRKQVIIASKGGNETKSDGKGWKWNPEKSYIIKACEGSLKRLQTDYIDLYQLHGGTIADPIDDTIEAFEILKQQGKIKYYGISSVRPDVIREYIKRSNIVSVMMQYSLADRRPEESILSLLQEHNVGMPARGTIAGGLLIDKPAKEYAGYTKEEIAVIAAAIKKVSGNHRSAAQTAIQFVLRNPAVTAAVAGIRTADQLKEAIDTLQAAPLNDIEMAMLQNTVAVSVYQEHT